MAAQPGEDLAATLFADVHYFYGPPTAKPPHHRFDKRSYVYLFENAAQRRARVQIANNAGTDDQDAFDGVLDNAHIEYSYRHPSLITITVDGIQSNAGAAAGASNNDHEWRLPTFDPKNENKYLYRLHTVDIYFWTKEDALSFMNTIRRTLPNHNLHILDEPAVPQAHRDEMSPVVQKLENVAISDPSYQQSHAPQTQAHLAKAEEPALTFAPMAYNPAAPAAPETIRHREKTPPPDDGAVNPLAAAANDQATPFNPGYQPQTGRVPSALSSPQGSYFPGPPQSASPYSQLGTGLPPPPPKPSPGFNPQNSHVPQAGFNTQYAPQQTQYANYPGSPGFQQPLQSPGFQQSLQSPGLQQPLSTPTFAPPPTQAQSVPPPPPTGGYSSYSYSQNHGMPNPNDYSVHQQVWRPTEGEHAQKHQPKKEPKGKIEETAGKLERGVTGFLKKVEKKYL